MKIEDIDKNFRSAEINGASTVFTDGLSEPFSVEGFPWRVGSVLRRLPQTLTAADVNEGALALARHTTGGAVRFRTDSRRIVIRATLADSCDMNHMPRAGSAGFDLYRGLARNARHVGTGQPNRDEVDFVREVVTRAEDDIGMEDWLINLPLYGGLTSLEIGLEPGATIEKARPHANRPIVFYGSSITQGGCASRPGNCYSSLLCRELDAEQINLGFSGSGRGEIAVARAIASLENLGAFVMDYDHNAPTIEHLAATHEAFFREIRQAQPTLPVVMLSMCDIWPDASSYAVCSGRRAIVRATYDNAIASGDKHVCFIDGETLFGVEHRDACAVDTCHPNDLGFYRMFENILPTLQPLLTESRA